MLAGCVDQSKGVGPERVPTEVFPRRSRGPRPGDTPGCMASRSFQMLPACNPAPNEYEWDWRVTAFPYRQPGLLPRDAIRCPDRQLLFAHVKCCCATRGDRSAERRPAYSSRPVFGRPTLQDADVVGTLERGGVGDARVAQPAADSSDPSNLACIEPIRQSVQEVAHMADPVAH